MWRRKGTGSIFTVRKTNSFYDKRRVRFKCGVFVPKWRASHRLNGSRWFWFLVDFPMGLECVFRTIGNNCRRFWGTNWSLRFDYVKDAQYKLPGSEFDPTEYCRASVVLGKISEKLCYVTELFLRFSLRIFSNLTPPRPVNTVNICYLLRRFGYRRTRLRLASDVHCVNIHRYGAE